MAEFLVRLLRHAAHDGLPHGAQQLRAGGGVDHVLHELADVQVQGDEVIGGLDFALHKLVTQVLTALATVGQFALGFGGQRTFGLHRRVDVAIRLGLEQLPHR